MKIIVKTSYLCVISWKPYLLRLEQHFSTVWRKFANFDLNQTRNVEGFKCLNFSCAIERAQNMFHVSCALGVLPAW